LHAIKNYLKEYSLLVFGFLALIVGAMRGTRFDILPSQALKMHASQLLQSFSDLHEPARKGKAVAGH
jgi:hypothetical protein